MRYHKLVIINCKGKIYKNYEYWMPGDVYQYLYSDFQISYVVNGADPKAQIKHIIAAANHLK